MRLERLGPASFRLTLHGYELATLTAAARLVAEGGGQPLPPEALEQLRHTLAAYDAAARAAAEPAEQGDGGVGDS